MEHLSTGEQQQLLDAIPLITILIAGADDNFDTKEREWALKLADIRSYSQAEALRPYYEKVEQQLNARLDFYLNQLSDDTDTRTKEVSAHLSKVNDILPKLDPRYAAALYQNWLSFAGHIARASGGILGWMSVGPKEKELLDLSMIQPVRI